VGLVLLVVFGTMAAGRARDMKLAGAVQNRVGSAASNTLKFLGFKDSRAIPSAAAAQPLSEQALAVDGRDSATTKAVSSPANATAKDATNKQKANENAAELNTQAKDVLKKTTQNVNKSVSKVTDDAGREFLRIWP
jgi:hypothetical protein